MHPTEIVKEIITKCFPSIKIRNISFFGEGMDSTVYLINNAYIFRFPKTKSVEKNMHKERLLLPHLKNSLDVKIPNFEYIGRSSKLFKRSYMGYKLINGKELSKDLFDSLSLAQKEKILNEIAEVIKGIHSFPLKKAKECGVKEINYFRRYSKQFKNIQRNIFPLLKTKEIDLIDNLFRQYLCNKENFKYTPTLLHRDLSPEHILVDKNRVVGIIDWGDLEIGDPDYELTFLLEDYGLEFIHLLAKYYEIKDFKQLISKLCFFICSNGLIDILDRTNQSNTKQTRKYINYFRQDLNFCREIINDLGLQEALLNKP